MTLKLEIEKGVPVPELAHPQSSTWAKMEVGDSVLADAKTAQNAYAFGKKNGKKFVSRTVEGGVRIWRIA